MEIIISKGAKILIPEIPGEWTERSRSGLKCIWNDGWHGKPHLNGLPYVELTAPEKGLYAEGVNTAWYWCLAVPNAQPAASVTAIACAKSMTCASVAAPTDRP